MPAPSRPTPRQPAARKRLSPAARRRFAGGVGAPPASTATKHVHANARRSITVAFASVMATLPRPSFMSMLMRQSVASSVPKHLVEAARIDCWPELGNRWRIVPPLLKPALGAVGPSTFGAGRNNFIGPLIGVRRPVRCMLPLRSLQSSVDTERGAPMAASVIVTRSLPVLVALASRQRIAGLTAGAVK